VSRLALLAAGLAAVGAVLALSELAWFRRAGWVDRIAPYLPGSTRTRRPPSVVSWGSFREVVTPLAASGGNRLSRLFGAREELAVRLERVHAPFTPASFRLRQLGCSLGGLGLAAVISVAVRPPPLLGALFLLGAPVLAFLVLEQQIARASARWQEQIRAELPIITEQLGMLLGAGYSLASALNRLARRGSGACATDLGRVCGRMRQGLGEQAALVEWAELADVDALTRLVSVLALNRQAADVGHLITEEARSMRRDAQRRLIETIERRAQQVWVPVTVAALVPGVLFMVVPFVAAMRLFTTS
jgi:tight adherence protein C